MARPLRIQYPGALYHVSHRGNGGRPIFRDDTDRQGFLEILARSLETYSVRLSGFVLLDDHFHLLVETPLANLSQFMRHFNITYTSFFNRRHHRNGHLFQGRFKSILIDGDEYLSPVSRYIHLSPVRVAARESMALADRLDFLWKYPWSSLPGYVALRKRWPFIDYSAVLREHGGDDRSGRGRYRKEIVLDLQDGSSFKEKIVGQSILGDEEFVRWVTESYLEAGSDRERPAIARVKRHAGTEKILQAITETTGRPRRELLSSPGPLRQLSMDLLYRLGGLKNPEIGTLMGLDYSTVSVGRKRFRESLARDRVLAELLQRIEEKLSS